MPSKTEEYLALAQRTANGLTRYWESWTAYLTTASRLYKYRFEDQLMIYAQRPDATACADYDIWNNRMNRYVRRGSKGIALLDESSGYPRLYYVFDVSDTGVRRNSRDPDLWQYNDDLKQPVSDALTAAYGISHERFSQQLADIAGKLVADYWDNNSEDIRAIVDGSFLMDYDSTGLEMQFKSAAAISVTYTLLERCGFEPDGFFDKDSFQAIYDFSTPDTVYALGAAVSDISREVLRTVERAVKTTIRRRNNERSQHEYEQQSELHADRGLSSPEPDPASAEDPAGQVRQDAPELPEAAAPGAVPHDAPEREPVPDPEQTGADRSGNEGPDDGRTAGEEPGSGQGEEPDGVGAAHEQSAGAGRGSDSDGTDLQLSFLDAVIPTETQQIEHIDRAESEKSPSAFVLSQAEIENALRRGSNVEGSKLRIWKTYQLQPDRKLRAKALANEYAPYGPGGSSHTYLDGSSGWLDHDSKGLTFEHYCGHCGAKLTLTSSRKWRKLSDGTLDDTLRVRYTCYGKLRKQTGCTGQTGYTVHILDEIIDKSVRQIFSKMRGIPKGQIITRRYEREVVERKNHLQTIQVERDKAQKDLISLKAEILACIKGESVFPKETLAEMITAQEEKLRELDALYESSYAETEKTAELMDNVSKLYEELISFSDLYDSASFEAKKMIVNQLIRRVDVYRGYQLNITFNFDLTPYIEGDDAAAC